eukprot:1179270-Prorocentrum_minimum.AAC.2
MSCGNVYMFCKPNTTAIGVENSDSSEYELSVHVDFVILVSPPTITLHCTLFTIGTQVQFAAVIQSPRARAASWQRGGDALLQPTRPQERTGKIPIPIPLPPVIISPTSSAARRSILNKQMITKV